jgi:arylsulfatase A-like enzyme
MTLSRRDFLKTMGLGAAVAGVSSIARPNPARASTEPGPISMPMPEYLEADLSQRLQVPGSTDPLAAETVQPAKNMEPFIPHDDQAAEAAKKLADLEKKTGKKPNIMIFLMDNVGYGDPGIYGGGLMAGAPTPNIDHLGHEGLQLLCAYSQPSCTPSRCTLLTGRLPMRHGQLRPSFAGEEGSLSTEITLPTLLSKAGYVTQGVGKWHCGEDEACQPQNVGFDDFYGFLGWSGLYTDWQDENFAPEFALSPDRQPYVKTVPFNDHIVHGVKGKKIEDLEEITIEISAQLDEKFASYSVDFIKKMADSDKPFFLYHCTRGNHVKNYPNPDYKGKSPAKYPYKDCMIELDDRLGQLVQALEDTNQLENTLIFVLSDNGPMMEPWPDAGFTPFRGSIGSTWEGGVRVPGIVFWKGLITPGQINDGLFDFCDFLPTLLNLAGASNTIPKDRYIDGIDQTSFLLADNSLSNRKYVYFWLQDTYSGHRVAEYKIMFVGTSFDDFDVVNSDSASTLETYPNAKLFNLYLDPKERYSFANRQTFMDTLFSDPYKWHKSTFVEYPPKKYVTKFTEVAEYMSGK